MTDMAQWMRQGMAYYAERDRVYDMRVKAKAADPLDRDGMVKILTDSEDQLIRFWYLLCYPTALVTPTLFKKKAK